MNDGATTVITDSDLDLDVDEIMDSYLSNRQESDDLEWSSLPKDYVVLYTGVRGGGKSLQLARTLLIALERGYPVYTNLPLFPEKLGIKNRPQPIDFTQLITFDPSITHAVIGIDEIGTWVQRKRAMSTSTMLIEQWLQQLRKRGLRVFCSTQIGGSLPTLVDFQVDKMIVSGDWYFNPEARERGYPRGVSFYGTQTDQSGLFTGRRFYRWGWFMANCRKTWECYDSYQTFDLQFGRKVTLKGGDIIYDQDRKEAYPAEERTLRLTEEALAKFSRTLKHYWRSWEPGLIKMARDMKAIVHERPDGIVMSVERLHAGLDNLKGKAKKDITQDYEELRELAGEGQIAIFRDGLNMIELSKPIQ